MPGQRDNPTLHHLEALATFFGVPGTFFTDAGVTAQVMAEYELVAAMRDSRIRDICLHARRLDQQALRAIVSGRVCWSGTRIPHEGEVRLTRCRSC